MRAAVIGGGTAGTLAAAQLTHRFPDIEIVHVVDPATPAIGVGEGSLPGFARWLDTVTGLPFETLAERYLMTYKLGIRFEGWGTAHPVFFHNFGPGAHAYHFSAARLPELLAPFIRAARVERRVVDVASDGRSVEVELSDGGHLRADVAFDARGFPRRLGEDHLVLPGIPTQAALVRPCAETALVGGTRAVARPHGWVFVIPLCGRTSFGYVFDPAISTDEEVRGDFDRLLDEEEAETIGPERALRFPNFRRRRWFDGALFRIGNQASFLEPLEATAIGLIQHQLEVATLWLGDGLIGVRGEARWHPEVIAEINREWADTVDGVALFIARHYLRGSRYATPFWRAARSRAEAALAGARGQRVGRAFERLVDAGAALDTDALARVRDRAVYDRKLRPYLRPDQAIAGFDAVSFGQIDRGLGIGRSGFSVDTERGVCPSGQLDPHSTSSVTPGSPRQKA